MYILWLLVAGVWLVGVPFDYRKHRDPLGSLLWLPLLVFGWIAYLIVGTVVRVAWWLR